MLGVGQSCRLLIMKPNIFYIHILYTTNRIASFTAFERRLRYTNGSITFHFVGHFGKPLFTEIKLLEPVVDETLSLTSEFWYIFLLLSSWILPELSFVWLGFTLDVKSLIFAWTAVTRWMANNETNWFGSYAFPSVLSKLLSLHHNTSNTSPDSQVSLRK